MYPVLRIVLKELASSRGEAVLDTLDGRPRQSQQFDLPLDSTALSRYLEQVEDAIKRGQAPPIRDVGTILYDRLFPPGPFRKALDEALDKGQRAGTEVHLQLCFDTDTDHALLQSYPWEVMRDHHNYLVANRRVVLSRYLPFEKPETPLSVDGPLRVLIVSPRSPASANDDRIEAALIRQAIGQALDPSRLIVEELSTPTYKALNEYLTTHQSADAPHIIHFDGHGNYGRRCPNATCHTFNLIWREECHRCGQTLADVKPAGYLMFYMPDGRSDPVSAEAFGNVLLNSGIRFVVLSTCRSAVSSEYDDHSGMAQYLIAVGIPAVLGMQFSIPVDVARLFASQLYLSLAQFDPIGEAVARGRAAIFNTDVWFPPVLFQGNRDAVDHLFVGKVLADRLPRALRLLGRDADLLHLSQMLLDPNVRGVLINEMGGSGKTVFAAEAALRLAWRFDRGVLWIDRQIQDIEQILPQIAVQLGNIQLNSDVATEQHIYQIIEAFHPAHTYLLALDGFVEALGDDLVHFLARLPTNVKVLITSRYGSQVDGIKHFALPLLNDEAASELFWANAGDARRSEDKANSIVHHIIEDHLARHPLAIEIAARMTKRPDMTLARLDRELKHSLDLLDDPTWLGRPERLRSVRASIDLSYRLLGLKDREALRDISVLINPWGEDTGRAVTELTGQQWIRVANALLDAALLQWRQQAYSLHPLVKEFAGERSVDRSGAHKRAANYLARLRDPIRQAEAHYHSVRVSDFKLATDILNSVYDNLFKIGQYRQLYEMVTITLNKVDHPVLRYWQAELLLVFSEQDKALRILEWVQSHYALAPRLRASVLNQIARIFKERDRSGDRDKAINVLGECLKVSEAVELAPDSHEDDRWWARSKRAIALHDLGMLFHYHGQLMTELRFAEALYTASSVIFDKLIKQSTGPELLIKKALTLKQLAELKTARNYPGRDIMRARAFFGMAVELFQKQEQQLYLADTLFQVGKLDQAESKYDSALEKLKQCESIYQKRDLKLKAAIMVKHQAEIFQEPSYPMRNLDQSIQLYTQALQAMPNYHDDKWGRRCTAQAYYRRGEAYLELGQWDLAWQDLLSALRAAIAIGADSNSDRRRVVRTFCALVQVAHVVNMDSFPLQTVEPSASAFQQFGFSLTLYTWRQVDCRKLLEDEPVWNHHELPTP